MSIKPIVAAGALAMMMFLSGGVSGSAAAQGQSKATGEDRSRRVCRSQTPVGSRLTRRVCRTQAEWDEAQYRTQDGVLQHQMTTTTQLEQAPRPQ
jgi:hypothetical protein